MLISVTIVLVLTQCETKSHRTKPGMIRIGQDNVLEGKEKYRETLKKNATLIYNKMEIGK